MPMLGVHLTEVFLPFEIAVKIEAIQSVRTKVGINVLIIYNG